MCSSGWQRGRGGSHRPCLLLLTQCALSVQVGTGDLDGFQADTEEEDDEEGDCVIMDISDVGGEQGTTPTLFLQAGQEGKGQLVTPQLASCE